MKYLLVTLIFLTTACGSGSDGGGNKGITSLWTAVDNSFAFDLSAGTLPISNGGMLFTFSNGAKCSCTVDVIGTETSGSYVLSACAYTSGGSGDPGCAGLDSSGTYSASGANMVLKDSGGSVTYK